MSFLSLPKNPPSIALSILLLVSHHILTLAQAPIGTNPKVPALFVFGDSIADPGNNNAINTIAKGNFPPYGIDFVGHKPTGRFCNGKLSTDFLVAKLGIKELLPAYLGTELEPQDFLTGVSFASAGSGFDPLTSETVSVVSMDKQLELFKEYKAKAAAMVGEEAAGNIISNSLYLVIGGTDDLANNYFLTAVRKATYDMPSYTNLLVQLASSFIEELINLGAREIGVFGIPSVGCLPSQRTLHGGISRDCVFDENQMALLFNSKLIMELQRINNSHQEAILAFVDIYTPLLDLIQNPTKYGFEVSTEGCCGTGFIEASFLCTHMTAICSDISKHIFWDSFHPTEKTNEILCDYIYNNYVGIL